VSLEFEKFTTKFLSLVGLDLIKEQTTLMNFVFDRIDRDEGVRPVARSSSVWKPAMLDGAPTHKTVGPTAGCRILRTSFFG
jgi:hypothetical protein